MSTQAYLADVEHILRAFGLAFAIIVPETNRAALAIRHVPALTIPFDASALFASLSSFSTWLVRRPFFLSFVLLQLPLHALFLRGLRFLCPGIFSAVGERTCASDLVLVFPAGAEEKRWLSYVTVPILPVTCRHPKHFIPGPLWVVSRRKPFLVSLLQLPPEAGEMFAATSVLGSDAEVP